MSRAELSALLKTSAAHHYEAISLLAGDPRPEAQAAREAFADFARELDEYTGRMALFPAMYPPQGTSDTPERGQHFEIGTERTYTGADRPTMTISVHVHLDADAPPALAAAVHQGIGNLITVGTDPNETDEISRQIIERAEQLKRQTQNEADAAARKLLGGIGEEGETTP